MKTGKSYWRGLNAHYLSDAEIPCDDSALRKHLLEYAFKPDRRHDNTFSVCQAGLVTMEEFLLKLRNAQIAKGREDLYQVCAVGVLFGSDLESRGFEIKRDNTGYKGHANVRMPDYDAMAKVEKHALLADLKNAAIANKVRFFVFENDKFRRVR